MIVVNKIKENVVVSCRNKEHSVMYTKEKFDELLKISEKSNEIKSLDELNKLLDKVEEICKNDFKQRKESFHPEIFVSPTNDFYLKIGSKISKVKIPDNLVRRIKESIDKEIDVTPIIKCWKRFLRNKKSSNEEFAKRFCNYIDLTYIRKNEYNRLIEEEGLSEEMAEELSKTYEVKITQEGLMACYKTSQEIEHKYTQNEVGDIIKINRYTKTFNEDTGEITGDSRDDLPAEQRVFMPLIMGTSGDAFYCEGPNGYNKPGYFIKIGCVHRLPDWSYVDCNDQHSCVKGLHVGGLGYIDRWGGEIHTCLVDPMHIGAIPDYSGSLAIRVLEYFVDGSLVALNHSIYHSSSYASMTDKKWKEVSEKILEQHGEYLKELENSVSDFKEL